MKNFFITLLFLSTIFAQDVVSIVTSGDGSTKDQATTAALRNAIEQAYGAFISSNTKFLNDELIQDEIVSVSQGNILNFEVISESQISNGYNTFIKATVSIDKLVQFIESKGSIVEVKGGLFSFNIKKEEFYQESESKALEDFLKTRLYSHILYDYKLLTGQPVVKGDNYAMQLKIGVNVNNNFYTFFNDLNKLLLSLDLEKSTVNFRTQSNLPVFYLLNDKNTVQLRSPKSFDLITKMERILFLKTADFSIETNPVFEIRGSKQIIEDGVIVNNFILFNRRKSPNPGVYWKWLPYEYNSKPIYRDRYSGGNDKTLEFTTKYFRRIPTQNQLNSYSGHMSKAVNSGVTEYNMVFSTIITLSRSDFEQLSSIEILPDLNKFWN